MAVFEAVLLYMQSARSIDNELAREVLKDNADEEQVKEVRYPFESRDEGDGGLISLTHNPLSHILQVELSSFEMITKQGIGGSMGSALETVSSHFSIER